MKTNTGRAGIKRMAEELFKAGQAYHINRITGSCYNLVVNFEIYKVYRTRRSCNRQILKAFKKLQDGI